MDHRRRALWALVILACMALLLAPAVWNGFPLLQYDTGAYLSPWYEGKLLINRSVPYGLLLVAGQRPDFWPVLILQSALTVWVLALTLRAQGLGNRPLLLLAIVAALCLLTTLPWLTAILLTDIFAGLAVLALYLLLLRVDTLRQGERAGLVALVAYAGAGTRDGVGGRRQWRGHRTVRLDAGRLRALLRPHVARWHRQKISRRALPRCDAAAMPL
jgi:hypothetical protein